MYRPLLLSCLIVAASLGGCFGGGDDEPAPSTTRSPGPDPDQAFRVLIRNYTTEGAAGEPINVTWEVLPTVDDDNATNQSILVPHTNIHWGNQSVRQPRSDEQPEPTPTSTITPTVTTTPTDGVAPQTTATATATTTAATTAPPTGTNATTPPNNGEASSYPNETAEQSGVAPALYNESFVVESPGLVYLRAHAIIGNRSFWSEEILINVTNSSQAAGQTHIVTIGGTPGGPLSTYSPTPLRIQAGDAVIWKNMDSFPAGNQHSATSDAGAPSAFDTGLLARNGESRPIYFNTTGTWAYHCSAHSNMRGSVIAS